MSIISVERREADCGVPAQLGCWVHKPLGKDDSPEPKQCIISHSKIVSLCLTSPPFSLPVTHAVSHRSRNTSLLRALTSFLSSVRLSLFFPLPCLPQSMMSVPVNRAPAMTMPSVPTPSGATCAPANQVMWATAPSAEVRSHPPGPYKSLSLSRGLSGQTLKPSVSSSLPHILLLLSSTYWYRDDEKAAIVTYSLSLTVKSV